MKIYHNIPPLYDENSNILILGSFPSVKSREGEFFYHHPQNRFWKVLKRLYNADTLDSIDFKKEFLLRNRIALWDVIGSCEINGSSDSSIRNAVPNDISEILNVADINQIFCNGGTAYKYYCRYIQSSVGREAVKLPSTSPANASYSFDRLLNAWMIIKKYQN